jgi:hypothetical protein
LEGEMLLDLVTPSYEKNVRAMRLKALILSSLLKRKNGIEIILMEILFIIQMMMVLWPRMQILGLIS